MFKRTKVCTGVLAALGGSLLIAMPAVAQTSAPTSTAPAGERIEITGSRIKTFQTDTASPVVSLGAEAIKIEGVRNIEQLLNNLPQVFADQGGQVSNGASGTATVNLRNLGSTRNLVLINGRRLPAGSVNDPSTDLNQIPISLIRRVDVLTGGASAAYGSDAISGVINFVLNDRFEGIQFDYNHQFYNHQQGNAAGDVVAARGFAVPGNKSHDGASNDVSVTLGGNFGNGKGNATVFLGYKKEKALLESERDFSACALGAGASYFNCGGSSTTNPARFTTEDFSASYTLANAAGAVRPYVATDAYNFGPLNYFRRPSERYNMMALGRYDFSDQARLYSEFSFHDDRTVAQIAPSGAFFGLPFTLTGANPYLSPSFRTAFGLNNPTDSSVVYIGRRNVEGGGRQDDRRHTSYRGVLGIKGDVTPVWSYDASAQVGKVLYQQTYYNDFSNARLAKALDIVRDGSGNPACRSAVDGSDPNCVPYNIFQFNGVTPAALNYLQQPLFSRGETSQVVATGTVTGDLGGYGAKSPWASNGLTVVLGAETRMEKLVYNTDTAFTTGDGAGQGGPTIGQSGSYHVRDFFGELRLPLIEKLPFAELLSVNALYRHSDYTINQKTNTYGLGLEFAPITQVKLRGSYQKSARAPNIVELYAAQAVGLFDLDADPCGGAINPATGVVSGGATAAQCARSGVTAAQYGNVPQNPAGQYNQITGGNPNLKPETAKSYTAGIVVQPARDLTVTVDYFHFKVDDVISTAPPGQTLALCLQTGSPALCNLIRRAPSGALFTSGSSVLATNANLAQKKTSGIDLQLDYGFKLANYGALDFSLIGTRLMQFDSTDLPGTPSYDCAGYYGDAACGTPLPKWRHKLRAGWTTPWNVSVAATWRHIDSVKIDNLNPDLGTPATIQSYRQELSQRNYLDLQASYTVMKNLTARVTVNNVFDKDPPLRINGSGFTNGNTYPVVYDALGRQVTLSLSAAF